MDRLENLLVKAPQRGHVRPGHKYIRRWWDATANRWRYEYHTPQHHDDHGNTQAMVLPYLGGKVSVSSEYDPKLKDALKRAGGKWDAKRKEWVFHPKDYAEKVRPGLREALYTPHAFERIRPHLKEGEAAEISVHPPLPKGPVRVVPVSETPQELKETPIRARIVTDGGSPYLYMEPLSSARGLDRDAAVQILESIPWRDPDTAYYLSFDPVVVMPPDRVEPWHYAYPVRGIVSLEGESEEELVQEAAKHLAPLAYAQGGVVLRAPSQKYVILPDNGEASGGPDGTTSPAPKERGAAEQPSLFPELVGPRRSDPKGAGRKGRAAGTRQAYQPPLFPPDMPLHEMAKALGIGPGTRLIIKAEERTIPVRRLKWVDRPREREKVPASHFLMPKERKFPYKNKDGSINCALLRAAISRAAQHGYPEVERRARALYQRHCGKKKEE
jgi:hypothetical protein